MRHTYKLIKSIISKEEQNRNRQIFSFGKLLLFVPFSLLSRLDESCPNVSLHLKNKLIMNRIIFLTPRTHRQKFRTRVVTRGNLKTDRDAEVYRDLYGHSTKMANISLRLKENKNVQLNHNRLLYYGANHVKITTK